MKVRFAGSLILVAGLALVGTVGMADDVKSGKRGGPFDVNAITGDQKGKKLCYV